MAARNPLTPALLAAAALLGAACPAGARAPAAPEQGSLDWVLDRLQADRAEDQKGPRVDPLEAKCIAYQKGESGLDEWAPVVDVLKGRANRPGLRTRATDALIERLRAEQQKGNDPRAEPTKATDLAMLRKVKREICLAVLGLMTEEDMVSRSSVFRLTEQFFPSSGVEWRPDDSREKRAKARAELLKMLNRK